MDIGWWGGFAGQKCEERKWSIGHHSVKLSQLNFVYLLGVARKKKDVLSRKNNIKPFKLNCYGSDEIINNLRFEVPKITKNIFQLTSGEMTFTPKGQVFVKNRNNFGNSYVIVVGLKEPSNGFTDSLRCLLLNPPTGVISNGIYAIKYSTQINYKVSGTSSFLVDRFCSKMN